MLLLTTVLFLLPSGCLNKEIFFLQIYFRIPSKASFILKAVKNGALQQLSNLGRRVFPGFKIVWDYSEISEHIKQRCTFVDFSLLANITLIFKLESNKFSFQSWSNWVLLMKWKNREYCVSLYSKEILPDTPVWY